MRTVLEVRKDLQHIIDFGVQTLYWYLSLLIIMSSFGYYNPQGFTVDIILSFTIGIAFLYIFNELAFVWMALFTRDYNGVPYFLNVFTKCYFEGSSLDKYNERIYK